MISIGGVVLSPDLRWEDEFGSPAVAQSFNTTILGNSVYQNMPLSGARTISLSAVRSGNATYGYFTRAQIQSIKEFEAAGTAVTFVYEDQTLNVVIISGGVKVRPFLAKANQGVDDYYTGSIAMREV